MTKTTNASVSANELAKQHVNAAALIKVKHGDGRRPSYLRVAKLADRTGRVGRETGVPYVVLQDAKKPEAKPLVMKPADAFKLFSDRSFAQGVDTFELLTGAKKDKAEEQIAKGPSKKERAIEIVTDMQSREGWSRGEILAKLASELEMSDAAANTYYQHINSGNWVAE